MILDFIVRPASSSFDVENIQQHLFQIEHAALDPIHGRMFMIARDAEHLDRLLRERQEPNCGFPFSAILVDVFADEILVNYRITPTETLRNFVQWLGESYDIVVFDEDGTNLSQAFGDQLLDNLFR